MAIWHWCENFLESIGRRRALRLTSALLLQLAMLLGTGCRQQPAGYAQQQPPPPDLTGQQDQAPPRAQQTPEQLQQLVAPIALYPDSLVAQILAASTFPDQVVEADRWLQAHPELKGDELAKAVDQQPWDVSVKALAEFPAVLGNMDKNLSWTSILGDAYYNQQQDVMAAVQVMRQHAQQAGNLKSTPQQTVTNDGSDVVIQPSDPQIVYVPAYDPWDVYGFGVPPWPGWYEYPGLWFGGPYLSFGLGFGVGFYGGFGWGWNNWGCDWHHHGINFHNNRYVSHSRTFSNRSNFARGGAGGRPFGGDRSAARGFARPSGESGLHSGALSHYGHGGETRGFSSRGQASVGGGHGRGFGGGHGGGGGGHGGGGGGGGHR